MFVSELNDIFGIGDNKSGVAYDVSENLPDNITHFIDELSSFVPFAIINKDGIVKYSNSKLLEIFSDNKDVIIDNNFEVLFPQISEEKKSEITLAMQSMKVWEGVTHFYQDQKEYWIKSKISPFNRSENNKYFLIVINDISFEMNYKSEKEIFEKHLNILLNNAIEAFYLLDETKKILAFNDTARNDIKKYLNKELKIQSDIYEYLFFVDHATFDQSFERALKGNTNKIQNLISLNGNDIWFEIEFRQVKDEVLSVGISVSYEDITKQKIYEESLHNEREKFRNILNNAPVGILIVDLQNNTVLNTNPAALEILEYDENELINNTLRNMTHTEDLTKENRLMQNLKNGITDKIEYNKRIVTKNGKIKYCKNIVTMLGCEENCNSALYIFNDISHQFKDDIIKSFLHDLSVAVNNTRDMNDLYKMIHHKLSGILDTSNFYIALFNKRKNTISFPYLVDQIDDDSQIINATESGSLTAQVISQKTPLLIRKEDILRIYGDDDELGEVPEVWLGAPLMIKNKVIGAIAVQNYDDPDIYDHNDLYLFESVSNQVARALEIKRREKDILNLKAGIDQNASAVIILDKDFCIEYANRKFYSVNKLIKKEVVGNSYKIHFSRVENCCDLYDKMIHSIRKGKLWKADIKNTDAFGNEIWEAITALPVKDENHDIINYLITREDITERKRIYRELTEAKEEAERLSKFKSNVLSNLSHELRTPLNGMLGFVQVLKKDEKDEKNIESIELIQNSGNRLLNTLNSLITLSSLESGEYQIIKNYSNLDEIVEFSLLQFDYIIKEKELNVVISKKYDKLSLLTDENIVSNIFKAILDNAIKYTDPGKSIEIIIDKTLYNGKPSLCIGVKDEGPGIDKDKIDFIFEAFRQGSEGISRTYEGMGLGLTIAYKMSRLIDASITVQSEIGIGSTFTLCL